MRRAARPADATIAQAVGKDKADRVMQLLDELAALLP
jgi:hypothetical protein